MIETKAKAVSLYLCRKSCIQEPLGGASWAVGVGLEEREFAE